MNLVGIINNIGTFLNNIRNIVVVLVFTIWTFFNLTISYINNDHINTYVLNMKSFDVVAPEIKQTLILLEKRHKCDMVTLHLIHNGTVFAANFHDKKLRKYDQSSPNKHGGYNPAQSLPLTSILAEKNHIEDEGHLYMDSARKKSFTNLAYIMKCFDVNNMVAIPVYKVFKTGIIWTKYEKVLIGLVTYEYDRETNLSDQDIENMDTDTDILESILQEI